MKTQFRNKNVIPARQPILGNFMQTPSWPSSRVISWTYYNVQVFPFHFKTYYTDFSLWPSSAKLLSAWAEFPEDLSKAGCEILPPASPSDVSLCFLIWFCSSLLSILCRVASISPLQTCRISNRMAVSDQSTGKAQADWLPLQFRSVYQHMFEFASIRWLSWTREKKADLAH